MLMVLLNALFISVGWSAGFQSGNTFQATTRVGTVNVRCLERASTFACRQSKLAPKDADYFVGPTGITADQVKLVSLGEDGKRHTRDEGYDARSGRSRKTINLWRQTLLQKPFLEAGVNKITYAILNRREIVGEGSFVVTVNRGGTLRCDERTITSGRSSDCENQITACDLYFSQAVNCR